MKPVLLSSVRKWFAPRSLQYQLLSRALFVISGLLVLIGLFQYILMSHFLYENTAQNMTSEVRAMPNEVWTNTDAISDGTESDSVRPVMAIHDSTVSYISKSGKFTSVFRAPDANPAPHLNTSVYLSKLTNDNDRDDDVSYQIVESTNGKDNLVVLVPVGALDTPIGVVQVSTDLDSLKRVLIQQLLIFIFLGAMSLIVGVLTLIPTLRRTLVPLSQMATSVKKINAGNMDQQIVLRNPQAEIEVLSTSFNAMLRRLARSFEAERRSKVKMRQFVADASHELRTPLTSIRGFLEVLKRGGVNHPEQLHEAISSMLSETERLSKLVQDLLTLARLDEERPLELTEGRLDVLLKEIEPQLRILAGQRDIRLAANEPVNIVFDADRIKQVVLNLFQNAVTHTDPTTGTIQITLEKDHQSTDSGVYLTVRDNGVGIPAEKIDQLFERFYRIDTARSRKHGGAGLGLSITKTIVDVHGGTIRCESTLGKGATFIIWLPVSLDSKQALSSSS